MDLNFKDLQEADKNILTVNPEISNPKVKQIMARKNKSNSLAGFHMV